jgi:diguanylate cyclase (GGDEF)-like protein/PAS domain S-box-containing protein
MNTTVSTTTDTAHLLLRAHQAISVSLARLVPPDQLFGSVMANTGELLGWDFGTVWRPAGDVLRCESVWQAPGLPLDELAAACAAGELRRGEPLAGAVWASGTAIWSEAPSDGPQPRAGAVERAGMETAVCFPLVLDGRVEAVAELLSRSHRERDEELLSGLEAIAAQLAQYLDRWHIHKQLLARDHALAAAANGVVIADATKRGFPLVYVNDGFERLTGYSREEALGRRCSFLQGPGTDSGAVESIARALREERKHTATLLNYRKDGTSFWNEVVLSPVHENGKLTQYIGMQYDVTDRRRAEERVAYLAYHDPLTGLGNRALLAKHVERAFERVSGTSLQVALLYLDLDDFKRVNDELGHAAGDELLRAVADRLRRVTRSSDLLARQGGDEFLVLLADVEGDAEQVATRVAEEVSFELAQPIAVAGTDVTLGSSVGISLYPRDAGGAEELLQHADVAMYRAKRAGVPYRVYARSNAAPAAATLTVGDARVELRRVIALDAALEHGSLRAEYQPIVDLESGEVVAYEALARGPRGSDVERPDHLFAAAREADRLDELDWACRGAAVRGALDAGLAPPRTLFVNVEPEALASGCPPELGELWRRAGDELRVVVEITERALTAKPAELLAAVAVVRARGWGIALDDVGADTRSLALMPLLRPDVIKLDLRLVQEQPGHEIAEIVNAVNAEAERTGATILAEGIENEAHLAVARAMGARLAQGWHFGRPAPLPAVEGPPPSVPVALAAPVPSATGSTPYEIVRAVRSTRPADKRLLLAMSRHLEQQARQLGPGAVVMSAFQDASRFTRETRRLYTGLAADSSFVAALGVGMDAEPAPAVRGAEIGAGDPLTGEWSIAVLGPHFSAALVALDLGDDGPDADRRFDYALTYDRDVVIEAAASLMRRVLPLGKRVRPNR